jgi:hypothetical protein
MTNVQVNRLLQIRPIRPIGPIGPILNSQLFTLNSSL